MQFGKKIEEKLNNKADSCVTGSFEANYVVNFGDN